MEKWISANPKIGILNIYGTKLIDSMNRFKLEWNRGFYTKKFGFDIDLAWKDYVIKLKETQDKLGGLTEERQRRNPSKTLE